jgi:hypothetical protein
MRLTLECKAVIGAGLRILHIVLLNSLITRGRFTEGLEGIKMVYALPYCHESNVPTLFHREQSSEASGRVLGGE